jgi:hypothetical protein
MRYSIALLAAAAATALGTTGCYASEGRLRARARYDLECNGSPLYVTKIDFDTRVVTGCGQRAIYVQRCDGGGDCTWILNGEVREVSANGNE